MISKARGRIGLIQKILAKPFVMINANPNLISILGLILALIGAYFVSQQNWPLVLLFFVLAPLMDLIDGTVARQLKKTSNFGNYFETMIDKFVDFVMIGSFVLFYPEATVLALGFSLISSYAKPRVALIVITDNHDWPAIGEHADKLIILLTSIVLAVFGYNYIQEALLLIAAIAAIGTVQRVLYAQKLIKKAEKTGNLLPYLKKKKER
jgi:archaetidylinositol phosphate synthase